VSFLVIYLFWSVHAGALRHLEETGTEVTGLRPLNMLWLLVIAFLPFPTALVGHRTDTASVPIYIGTMFVLSALTAAIVTLAHRTSGSRLPLWGWWTTAIFAACTLIGVVNADAGLYALLALAVLRVVESRVLHRP
ncbi:MAG TPA: hypothetical protein VFJ14_11230, partial [Nocardioidaceae bacterium]|nr:hypothetical protein [Nocardioidaceae bacterium]